MPQMVLKSWFAKRLPLALRCSNLLREIQQLGWFMAPFHRDLWQDEEADQQSKRWCWGTKSNYLHWHWAGPWALTSSLVKIAVTSLLPASSAAGWWDMRLSQGAAQCPLLLWHIPQLMLVVGPSKYTVNGLATNFWVSILPACCVLVLLHISGIGELSYNSQCQPLLASTSRYLPFLFPCTLRGIL